jgi:hypothetical protein
VTPAQLTIVEAEEQAWRVGFRPEPTLVLELGEIEEDHEDATLHPTAGAGEVPYSRLESAQLALV